MFINFFLPLTTILRNRQIMYNLYRDSITLTLGHRLFVNADTAVHHLYTVNWINNCTDSYLSIGSSTEVNISTYNTTPFDNSIMHKFSNNENLSHYSSIQSITYSGVRMSLYCLYPIPSLGTFMSKSNSSVTGNKDMNTLIYMLCRLFKYW